MAVLNKIRQRSVFLIVIIALALFSFVLADVLRNGGFSSQKSQNTVASVNGEEIKREDFARKVNAASRSFGNGSSIRAVNYVYDQEVRGIILKEQFETLGLQIGNDKNLDVLEESLRNNPTFQNEAGVFDIAKVKEYRDAIRGNAQAEKQWKDFENGILQSAKEQEYFNMIKAAAGATLKEGELTYKAENDKVSIKYAQVPYSTIVDSTITVSDSEIAAYIKDHPKEFKTEATRDIQYVFFKEEPSLADENELKKEVEALLNTRTEYNNASKATDTLPGFKTVTDYETFVNENSAMKFQDKFSFKKDLPAAVADTLYNTPVGGVYGPYKDGGYIKLSRVVAQKQLPDSVKASHILVSWKGLQTETDSTRTKEQAKVLADSILKVVKRSKSKFTELAAKYSADNSNKDKGGDLDYFTFGRMVPAFNDYAFEGKVGDIGVVETQFGYHIIDIKDQKNKQKAVKIATIAQKIEVSEKTSNDVFKKTTKFEMTSSKGNFAEVAAADKYEVKPVNKIKALDEFIPGLQSQRTIVQWAFDEERAIGSIKRFQVKDGFAVVQLTAKAKAGLMSVADARTNVEGIIRNEKKGAKIIAGFSGATIEEIAKSQKVTVKNAASLTLKNPTISGAGNEPKVVGTAFGLEKGKVSKPIQGEKGVYVIEVTGKTEAKKLDNYKSYANKATKEQINAVDSQVIKALKEAAEIEDSRAKFY